VESPSAELARKPGSNPGDNKSCESGQGTKARKSPGDNNQCEGGGGGGGGGAFTLAANGITVLCPTALEGDSGVVGGITHTKRSRAQITAGNAATTCTGEVTDKPCS
jgi:hypothetical protein